MIASNFYDHIMILKGEPMRTHRSCGLSQESTIHPSPLLCHCSSRMILVHFLQHKKLSHRHFRPFVVTKALSPLYTHRKCWLECKRNSWFQNKITLYCSTHLQTPISQTLVGFKSIRLYLKLWRTMKMQVTAASRVAETLIFITEIVSQLFLHWTIYKILFINWIFAWNKQQKHLVLSFICCRFRTSIYY